MSQQREVAALLRTARESKGLDIRAVSRRSGIHQSHLLAIEEGRSESFHGLYYLKHAVMAYAKAVGHEEQIIEIWSDEDWGHAPAVRAASSLQPSNPEIRRGMDVAIVRSPLHYFLTFSAIAVFILLINNLAR
jgi:cytoskeletal protein RodZ